jgi:hypothetical protein
VTGSGTADTDAAKFPDPTAVKSASAPGGTTVVGGMIEVKLREIPSSAFGSKFKRLDAISTFFAPMDDAFRLAADPDPEKMACPNVPDSRLSPAVRTWPPDVTTTGPR